MFIIRCGECQTEQPLVLTDDDGLKYIKTEDINIKIHYGGEITLKCNCCGHEIEEE